jgi:hypothetical protein
MKKLFLICFALLFYQNICIGVDFDYILITYIGEQDNSIVPILISTVPHEYNPQDTNFYFGRYKIVVDHGTFKTSSSYINIVTDKVAFITLSNYIISENTKNMNYCSNTGSFQILLSVNNFITEYIVNDKQSLLYFNNMLNLFNVNETNTNDELIKSINSIINRIK